MFLGTDIMLCYHKWLFFIKKKDVNLIVLRLITEALQKMKGKIPEIAGSHVSSRVLQVIFSLFLKFQISSAAESMIVWLFFVWPQTCVKYCSQTEREAVFAELRPHLLTLACNTYAVHLLKKMLDTGMVMMLQGLVCMVSSWWCSSYCYHGLILLFMMPAASKSQLAGVISSLRGHAASLLRHMVGSVGMLEFIRSPK